MKKVLYNMKYLIQHWKGELSLAKSFWLNFVLFSILLTVQIAFYYAIIKTCVQQFSLPYYLDTLFLYLLILIALVVYVWQITGVWRCCLKSIKLGKKIKALLVMVIIELFVLLSIFTIISKYKITNAKIDKEKNYKYSITIVDNATKIHLVGNIKKGLSKDIKNTLKSNSNITGIIIDSYGGLSLEGYKLAKLIEDNKLTTYVSSICASAGTIAFIAGKERYMEIDAKIGFHYGYGVQDYPEVFNLTRWDIFPLKKTKNKTDRMQFKHIAKYGVSKEFIKKLKDHKTIDLLYPSTDELLNSGYIHEIKDITSISNIGVEYKNNYEARILQNKAIKLSNECKDESAIKLLTEAIELVDNSSYLYYNRAVSNKKLQQYEPMIPDLTKALELCEESDDFDIKHYKNILDFRNHAYFNLEQYDKAIEDMNAIIKIDTLHATYYHNRGYVYAFLDSFSLAVKDFSKAIAMRPDFHDAIDCRGITYYQLKEYKKSITDLTKSIVNINNEESYFPLLLLGAAYIEIQHYEDAIETLLEYLKTKGTYHDEANLLLAIVYYKTGDNSKADRFFCIAESLKVKKEISWEKYDLPIYYSTEIKKTLKELGKL